MSTTTEPSGFYELGLPSRPHDLCSSLLVHFKTPICESRLKDFPRDWISDITDEDDDHQPSQKAMSALAILCVSAGYYLRLLRVRVFIDEDKFLIDAVKLELALETLEKQQILGSHSPDTFGSALQFFTEALMERNCAMRSEA